MSGGFLFISLSSHLVLSISASFGYGDNQDPPGSRSSRQSPCTAPAQPCGGSPPAPHTDGEVRLGRPSARPWPRPWRGLGAVPGSPAVRSGTALPSSSPPPALSPSRRRGPWRPRLTGSSALGSTPKPALPVRSVLRARPSPRPREPAGRLSPLPWRKPLGSPETPRACALRLGCPAAASSASPVLTPALSGAQAARLYPRRPRLPAQPAAEQPFRNRRPATALPQRLHVASPSW